MSDLTSKTGVASFAVGEVRRDWLHDTRLVLLSDYEALDACLREMSGRIREHMAVNVRLAQRVAELEELLQMASREADRMLRRSPPPSERKPPHRPPLNDLERLENIRYGIGKDARDVCDAERYRFLRQPGNAIVYAKDCNAWGKGQSGHVRYETPEQLDAAVDAALDLVSVTKSGSEQK